MTKDDAIRKLKERLKTILVHVEETDRKAVKEDEDLQKYCRMAEQLLEDLSLERRVNWPESRASEIVRGMSQDSKVNIERLALSTMTERGLYGNDGPREAWTEAVIVELSRKGII